MVAICARIRNRYAHCNWADSPDHKGGLFFADLEKSEFDTDTEFFHHFRHVSIGLLKQQLTYFAYAREWLDFLDHEIAVKQGRLKSHFWPKPQKLEPPPEHSPVEKHIPPWLSEGQKDLFVQHIQAAKTRSSRPTPAQRAQEKARAEKKTLQAENIRRSQEGEARSKSRSSGQT
ncbi:MAG: hypothetical protein WDN46_07720 [Methylocella sp.]